MASITITADMFARLSETARAEVMMNFGSAPTAAAPAPAPAEEGPKKRGRKPKKVVDPNAPPKEKRAPNDWIVFSGRVEKLVRAGETERGAAKEEKMRTVVVKQFASSLKKAKAMDEWTDEEIVAALSSWTPPEKEAAVAEPVAAVAAEPAAAEPTAAEPAATEKRRGPKKLSEMSAEERAAHDAKIAERKAKKGAAPAAAAE